MCYELISERVRRAHQKEEKDVDESTVSADSRFWVVVPPHRLPGDSHAKMPKHAKQQPSIPIFGSEEPLATVLAALEIEGNDVCFDCDRSVVGG